MKKFKIYLLSLIVITGFFSCDDEKDALTGNAETGGLLTDISGLVGYVVGNGNDFEYTAKATVFQGAVKTTKIQIYKSFTNVAGVTSNEVLLKSIDLSDTPQNQVVQYTMTYDELKEGLTIAGAPLPTDDSLLKIGDAWTLKYVTTTSEGNVHVNAKTTKVAVGTRPSGTYRVIESQYWRLGVNSGSWNGEVRVIESVDIQTYRFVGYAGSFAAETNTHYFTIDPVSNVVNTPQTYNGEVQLLNGWPLINCTSNPTDMAISCGYPGPQNIFVKDDVNGKDKIYRTYGYYTGSGATGPREFYEVLEKIVE